MSSLRFLLFMNKIENNKKEKNDKRRSFYDFQLSLLE